MMETPREESVILDISLICHGKTHKQYVDLSFVKQKVLLVS